MYTFNGFFPILVLIGLLLAAWSLYEQSRFTRPEGAARRGVTIWTDPLTWEVRQFLEELPPGPLRDGKRFIHKLDREVLIGEEQSLWSRFSRRNSMRYVGYVNLSAPQAQLEFRVPWSALASAVIGFGMVLLIFIFFTQPFSGPTGFQPVLCLSGFLLFFLVMFAVSIWLNHRRERQRLLNILSQAMAQGKQGL